jgi:hypothetical protein
MQWSPLLTVVLVLVASLVGASGPAIAQSQSEQVTLTLEVVVPSSNERLGGVTLVASWEDGETRATTASNGKVFVDVPRGASVEITLDDPEYIRNQPYRIRVATEKEHTIEVARKAEVDVVVSDAEGPVADANVVLRQDDTAVVTGRTDSDGVFQSGTIEQGRYTVSVVKSGYYQTTRELIVAGSPERSVTIERGRIDYDVVVEDDHFDPAEPVTDATVSIERVGDLTTDERGAVATLLPVNSELRVQVSKDGYETATRTVSVDETRGSVTLSISREPSLSLTAVNERVVAGEVVPVEVTNAYGEPAADVELLLDGEPVGRTDANGEATVRIDEPGDHDIQARRDGTTSETVTVRGIDEGSSEAQQTETEAAAGTTAVQTTETAGDGGSGIQDLLVTVVPLALLLALGVVIALVIVRRRGIPEWREPTSGGDSDTGGVTLGGSGDTTETGVGGEAEGALGGETRSDTSGETQSDAGGETQSDAGSGTQPDTGGETQPDAGGETQSDTGGEERRDAGDE